MNNLSPEIPTHKSARFLCEVFLCIASNFGNLSATFWLVVHVTVIHVTNVVLTVTLYLFSGSGVDGNGKLSCGFVV